MQCIRFAHIITNQNRWQCSHRWNSHLAAPTRNTFTHKLTTSAENRKHFRKHFCSPSLSRLWLAKRIVPIYRFPTEFPKTSVCLPNRIAGQRPRRKIVLFSPGIRGICLLRSVNSCLSGARILEPINMQELLVSGIGGIVPFDNENVENENCQK